MLLGLALVFLLSCEIKNEENKEEEKEYVEVNLSLAQANQLSELPLACIVQEYPNKLNQVISDSLDLKGPKELHPSFYGCLDWHSAVHGHWSLVKLLKDFPNLKNKKEIKRLLLSNISKENIAQEIAYFSTPFNENYERTYGWAWLLKLDLELSTWQDPFADSIQSNLEPLTALIVEKYINFLPKLNYALRVGTHSNTAFGLSLAYDWALFNEHEIFKSSIEERALYFFKEDKECPLSWEPSGTDFLSPCLEEASLMKKVMNEKEYKKWLKRFLPQLFSPNFELTVGKVLDRTDGYLVHLDGLNFSRAWCLYQIADGIKGLDHLKGIGNRHIAYSLPNLVGDHYMGGHWLASFAIYALDQKKYSTRK